MKIFGCTFSADSRVVTLVSCDMLLHPGQVIYIYIYIFTVYSI